MSRPFPTFCTASLVALSLVSAGCGTVYSRMYSPKKTHYVRPAEKAVPAGADLLPPEATITTAPTPTATSLPVMPAPSAPAPETPAAPSEPTPIPGL